MRVKIDQIWIKIDRIHIRGWNLPDPDPTLKKKPLFESDFKKILIRIRHAKNSVQRKILEGFCIREFILNTDLNPLRTTLFRYRKDRGGR